MTPKEETIITQFLLTKYPILSERQVQFKIGKVQDQDFQQSLHLPSQMHVHGQQFNIVFYGQSCPLSRCCRLSLCLSICGVTASVKINCMASTGNEGGTLSHYNPQQQYPLAYDLLSSLFPHRFGVEEGPNNQLDSARSGPGKQVQFINQEVQKVIATGQHKFQSLRAVVISSRDQLKRKKKRRSGKSTHVNENGDLQEEEENIDDMFCDNDNEGVEMEEMMSDD